MASALMPILSYNANTQICNGIPNAAVPMIAKTFELRAESNRLPLAVIRLEVYGKLSPNVSWQPIASARTIGGVHDVARDWGDRLGDSSHGLVETSASAVRGSNE